MAVRKALVNVSGETCELPAGDSLSGVLLSGLDDANISSLADQQLLKYDSGTGKWINFTSTFYKASGNAFGADSTIGLTDAFKLSFITNNAVAAYCDANGNWSFGTAASTSNATASFRNAAGPIAGLFGGSGNAAAAVGLGSVSGGAFIQGYNATASATTNLVMQTSGANVLIGTATDGGEKFQVSGTMAFDLGSDASGDIYYRNSSGSVTRLGIGVGNKILQATSGNTPAWQTPTTDHLTEGANLFFTNARAVAAFSVGTGISSITSGIITSNDVVYRASSAINLKATGNTTVFTTEAGKGRFIIREIRVHLETITGAGSAASVSMGVTSAAYTDIVGNTALTALASQFQFGPLTLAATQISIAASTAVIFKVNTAATFATANTCNVYVSGYYQNF